MQDVSTKPDKIEKPGYHIRPRYDLHGLRQRRGDSSKGQLATELPLTSMIDMFSILVIYLLMNFSATGDVFFESKPGLVLPTSGVASPLESAPLISFSKGTYILDALDPIQGQIRVEDASENLAQLSQALKNLEQTTRESRGSTFTGKVNLQADENTPLLYIKRAMAIATTSGWSRVNFVVQKR